MKKVKQKLNKILTPDDLQAIGDVVYGIVDKQVATLATKKDLEDLTSKKDLTDLESRLNTRMNEGFEAVVQGMDNLADGLAEKERVENLERWASTAGTKIGFRSQINN